MAEEETQIQVRSRNKLVDDMQRKMNRAQGRILDLAESAIGNKERFLAVRPKILRETNDFIRTVDKELQRHYRIEFESSAEDVVVVQSKRGGGVG